MAQTSMNKKRKFSSEDDSNSNSYSWADLDNNILHYIFRLLTPKELFGIVSKVCHSWRSASWDVLFWKDEETLELTGLTEFIDYRRNEFELLLNYLASNLSQRSVKTIICAPNIYYGLKDIKVLATRFPMVKRVIIPNTRSNDLSVVLKFWKNLEEISIGLFLWNSLSEDISKLKTYPNNLTTLHLSDESYDCYKLKEYNSKVIAMCLHQLKELSIDHYGVCKDGVRIILCKCKNLTRLSIKQCRTTGCESERELGIRRKDSSAMISVKIEKKIEGENIRWSIDSMKRLF